MQSNHDSKIKICVSGVSGTTKLCNVDALEIGRELGRNIVEHDCIVTTTSTTGFPLWTAIGAKQRNGTTISFSPASNHHDHTFVHRLPTEYFDIMVYTSFGSAGAGIMAVRSSDAIIFGCGSMTTLMELSIAIEEEKPIGILAGPWNTDEVLQQMLTSNYPDYTNFVVDRDPRRLLEQILKMVKVQKIDH